MPAFIARRIAAFSRWWHAPIHRKDRVRGALVGALGGLWMDALATLVFTSLPIALGSLAAGTLAGAALCLGLGAVFPKVTTLVLFPFAVFG